MSGILLTLSLRSYGRRVGSADGFGRRLRGLAGERSVTLHDLRRTAGSLMAQAGVPLYHISSVLGHKSEAVTQVYARLGEDETKGAVDVLGSSVSRLQEVPASVDTDALDSEEAALRARLAEIEATRTQRL